MGDDYDDEQFEEDEVQQTPEGTSQGEVDEQQPQSELCSWKAISYDEIELGEHLGGGSMGLVHRGTYKGDPVAVKTLVSSSRHSALKTCTLDPPKSLVPRWDRGWLRNSSSCRIVFSGSLSLG